MKVCKSVKFRASVSDTPSSRSPGRSRLTIAGARRFGDNERPPPESGGGLRGGGVGLGAFREEDRGDERLERLLRGKLDAHGVLEVAVLAPHVGDEGHPVVRATDVGGR